MLGSHMGGVKVLSPVDAPALKRLLDVHPIENIAVAARLDQFGINRATSGIELVGYWESDRLVSVLSDGFSLHPIGATPEALDAFSRWVEHRRCTSILGVRDEAIGLWERLCERSFTQWASPREVRDHQMVMAIPAHTPVRSLARVQVIPTSHLDAYHDASIAMYTEEVCVAPMDPYGSYREHVAGLMMKGLTLGVIDAGRVTFKADIVAQSGPYCQVGGVWLAPDLRGQGLSVPLMEAVVALCRERVETVTLYVNYYNASAVRCYEAVGFVQVGECATVMY